MKRPIIRGMGRVGNWGIPVLLCVCWLLSISHATPTYGSDFPRQGATDIRNSQFAIENFDSDQQPDLATVEMVRFNPLYSRYWVSFRLSSGRQQTMGVTGPSEGLALLARDVNGDRAVDVVLVTAWQHRLIAVLLNDGAGNFAAADPAQFRFSTAPSTSQFEIVLRLLGEDTILPIQYSPTGDLRRSTRARAHQHSNLALPRSLRFASSLSQSSISGRAPPDSVLHA